MRGRQISPSSLTAIYIWYNFNFISDCDNGDVVRACRLDGEVWARDDDELLA